jgi:outer membrane protein OmpA-like peptidoglycan-associated protein
MDRAGEPEPLHKPIIRRFVDARIIGSALVEVMGYTDSIGMADRRKRIAQMVASVVARKVVHESMEKPLLLKVYGVGEEFLLLPHDLPESILYNNRVRLRIHFLRADEIGRSQ